MKCIYDDDLKIEIVRILYPRVDEFPREKKESKIIDFISSESGKLNMAELLK